MNEQVQERTLTSHRTLKAQQHQVIIFNDDVTPVEYVVWLLMTVFDASQAQAIAVAMEIHTAGRSSVATYMNLDVARQKVHEIASCNAQHGMSLRAEVQTTAS